MPTPPTPHRITVGLAGLDDADPLTLQYAQYSATTTAMPSRRTFTCSCGAAFTSGAAATQHVTDL